MGMMEHSEWKEVAERDERKSIERTGYPSSAFLYYMYASWTEEREKLKIEIERLQRSMKSWEAEALNYAKSRSYQEERAEKAEAEVERLKIENEKAHAWGSMAHTHWLLFLDEKRLLEAKEPGDMADFIAKSYIRWINNQELFEKAEADRAKLMKALKEIKREATMTLETGDSTLLLDAETLQNRLDGFAQTILDRSTEILDDWTEEREQLWRYESRDGKDVFVRVSDGMTHTYPPANNGG